MNKKRSLSFLKLSVNYLHSVNNAVEELIKQGNKGYLVFSIPFTDEEYEEGIKWADFNIAEPLFFNFYHGLELMMKGYLMYKNIEAVNNGHEIQKLYENFCNYYSGYNNTITTLKKYIGSGSNLIEPLKSFFNDNNIDSNAYYEALKYPERRKSIKPYEYDKLKDLGEKAIGFYRQLSQDISLLIKETVTFGRNNLEGLK